MTSVNRRGIADCSKHTTSFSVPLMAVMSEVFDAFQVLAIKVNFIILLVMISITLVFSLLILMLNFPAINAWLCFCLAKKQ